MVLKVKDKILGKILLIHPFSIRNMPKNRKLQFSIHSSSLTMPSLLRDQMLIFGLILISALNRITTNKTCWMMTFSHIVQVNTVRFLENPCWEVLMVSEIAVIIEEPWPLLTSMVNLLIILFLVNNQEKLNRYHKDHSNVKITMTTTLQRRAIL